MTGAVESEHGELTPANTACHSGGLLAVTLGATCARYYLYQFAPLHADL